MAWLQTVPLICAAILSTNWYRFVTVSFLNFNMNDSFAQTGFHDSIFPDSWIPVTSQLSTLAARIAVHFILSVLEPSIFVK